MAIKWERSWFVAYLYQAQNGGVNYGYKTFTTTKFLINKKTIVEDCLNKSAEELGVDKELIAVTAFNRI